MKFIKVCSPLIALLAGLVFTALTLIPKSKQIFLIGDSTMTDYSLEEDYADKRFPMVGWGQVFQPLFVKDKVRMLPEFLQAEDVKIINKAKGGRSTRTFFEQGRWLEVYNQLQKGDVVLIQFGHNDAAKDKPERYVDLNGYKAYLRLFIMQAREKGAVPILITPVARNYPWKDGRLENVHGDYPDTMIALAKEMHVQLIDLNVLSRNAFTQQGQAYVTQHYFMNLDSGKYKAYPDGLKDNTHFQEAGAKFVAQLVFNALKDGH